MGQILFPLLAASVSKCYCIYYQMTSNTDLFVSQAFSGTMQWFLLAVKAVEQIIQMKCLLYHLQTVTCDHRMRKKDGFGFLFCFEIVAGIAKSREIVDIIQS